MRAARLLPLLFVALLLPVHALAGFTETLPTGTFLLDVGWMQSTLDSKWDNRERRVPLIEEMVRYEPGSGRQGTLKPQVEAELSIFAIQLFYGITDSLSVGGGLPLMQYADIDPNFDWERGDYQWSLGRSYSETDFWEWAGSMGQPKPGHWRGNEWIIGDVQLGVLFRFSDYIKWFEKIDSGMGLTIMGALPTGKQPDPEEVITAGTTSWDFHSNGDLGFRVGYDKFFHDSLDGRLTLGTEVFYEIFFPHSYISPEGKKNPLMCNYRAFTGKHYTIDGGDWLGASAQIEVVPLRGPALGTWLVKGDASKAEALPPLLTLQFRYTYINMQQSDWDSDSEIWDWDREKEWRPGFKQILFGKATIGLLRLGLPLMPYVSYRNLTWLESKNCRAPNVLGIGTRVLLKFW
ncbi:MAG TPA: hypothetical protein PKW95_05480 [bacterium]|nr:hypothetical protein [bacterium]